jgi:hypothetical protein
MRTPIDCHNIVNFTYDLGKWFLIVAVVAALAMAAAEAVAKFTTKQAPPPGKKGLAGGIGDILGPLKDLLVALGNLPAWFAIFLAGGALIWFARDTIAVCRP